MNLMFSKKGIVYLSKTHVSLYYKDIVNPLRVDFDRNILENPTESDKEWLKSKLKIIEDKVKLKKLKAVLILSKDLVFDKIVDEDNIDKRILEINEFLAGLPIGVDLVEGKEFIKEDNVLVTATNKKLYLSLIEVLKPLNIQIDYVLPEIVFNRVEFNKAFLEEVFRERILLNFGNFLEEDVVRHKLTPKKVINTLLICAGIGIIIGISTYFINKLIPSISIDFTQYTNSKEETIVDTDNKNKEGQTQNNVLTEDKKEKEREINKNDITISVLNGTGIPGFATEIANLIKGVGYINITTANASNFNYTNTVIELDETIPSATIEEIRTSLKGKLKSFEIKKSKDLTNKIIVTTGEVIQN